MTLSEVQIFRQYGGKQILHKIPGHIIILFSSFLKSIHAYSGSFFPLLIVCKKMILLLSVWQVLTSKKSYRKCKANKANFLSPSGSPRATLRHVSVKYHCKFGKCWFKRVGDILKTRKYQANIDRKANADTDNNRIWIKNLHSRNIFLAHQIRKSVVLDWDRNSVLTLVFLPRQTT